MKYRLSKLSLPIFMAITASTIPDTDLANKIKMCLESSNPRVDQIYEADLANKIKMCLESQKLRIDGAQTPAITTEECPICMASIGEIPFYKFAAERQFELDKQCKCAAKYCRECLSKVKNCPTCRAHIQEGQPELVGTENDLLHPSMLLMAAATGDVDLLNRAIEQGADINLHHLESGNTTLMLAILYNHLSIVERLLTIENLDINARNSHDGATALIYSVESLPILEQLLQSRDIDINARDYNGKNAIMWAEANGMDEAAIKIMQDPRFAL